MKDNKIRLVARAADGRALVDVSPCVALHQLGLLGLSRSAANAVTYEIHLGNQVLAVEPCLEIELEESDD